MSSIYRRKYGANIYYNSGNVGIGTSSMTYSLEVSSRQPSGAGVTSFPLRITAGDLAVTNQGNNTATLIGLATEIGNSSRIKCAMGHCRTDSNDRGAIVFLCNNVNDANSCTMSDERMRITSTGNVGIGTATPAGKLDINSGFVYIDGFKQPFSRTGTVNGVYYVDIPTLFGLATTTVHTCEIVFGWYIISGSINPTASLYGISSGGTGYNPSEVGYIERGYTGAYFNYTGNAITRVMIDGVDSTTKIRITRIVSGYARSSYICETVYGYANIGTYQNFSIGWFNAGGQVSSLRIQMSSSTAYMYGSWTATYYHV